MSNGFSKISKPLALSLLALCDGDDIWSCDYCRSQRVPEDWIAKLRDVFESDFSDHANDHRALIVAWIKERIEE